MTRLLVSVRSGDEAELALAGGADLIDVKEPNRGALGAADAAVIRDVIARVAGRAPVSAALGELQASGQSSSSTLHQEPQDPGAMGGLSALESTPGAMGGLSALESTHSAASRQGQASCPGHPPAGKRRFLQSGSATLLPADVPPGLDYVKLGLAGCAESQDWCSRWTETLAGLPGGVSPVAVAYADWRSAAAPQPGDVLEAARQCGCSALLVDTFDKSRGGLLDHWPLENLTPFVARVKACGIKVVLAGSLDIACLAQVLPLKVDYVAFRGAVCSGGRTGTVDRRLVDRLAGLVRCGVG